MCVVVLQVTGIGNLTVPFGAEPSTVARRFMSHATYEGKPLSVDGAQRLMTALCSRVRCRSLVAESLGTWALFAWSLVDCLRVTLFRARHAHFVVKGRNRSKEKHWEGACEDDYLPSSLRAPYKAHAKMAYVADVDKTLFQQNTPSTAYPLPPLIGTHLHA